MKNVDNMKIKEIHLDTYMNEPYMLLSRVIDKNVSYYYRNDRIVLRNKDDAVIMNVPLKEIERHSMNKINETHYQVLFNICDVQYKVLAVI